MNILFNEIKRAEGRFYYQLVIDSPNYNSITIHKFRDADDLHEALKIVNAFKMINKLEDIEELERLEGE